MASENVMPDTENLVEAIRNAAVLANWIEGARKAIDDIWTLTEIDPTLQDALRKHDIRCPCEWGECESSALRRLMSDVERNIASLAPAARAAVGVPHG